MRMKVDSTVEVKSLEVSFDTTPPHIVIMGQILPMHQCGISACQVNIHAPLQWEMLKDLSKACEEEFVMMINREGDT